MSIAIRVSRWVRWAARNNLPDRDRPCLYIIGRFAQATANLVQLTLLIEVLSTLVRVPGRDSKVIVATQLQLQYPVLHPYRHRSEATIGYGAQDTPWP